MAANHFSPSDYKRLRTCSPEIAADLQPNAQRRDTATETRFGTKGSLAISKWTGDWFDFSSGKGGHSPISLIRHLTGWDRDTAIQWALEWLRTHPGDGSCRASDDERDDDDVSARVGADYARQILAMLVPVPGTPGEAYLRSRGLEPPYSTILSYLPDARLGEGALVGALHSSAGMVGLQLLYIDPDGRKSTLEPKRRVFYTERWRAAAFRLEVSDPVAGAPSIVIAEGLEDALSVAQAKAAALVLGVPGVARIGTLSSELANLDVTVLRDGDEPGSLADKALLRGIDDLLLRAPGKIRITSTPRGADANSIFSADGGTVRLHNLIFSAALAELSVEGEIRRCARMGVLEYEQARGPISQKFNLRLPILDQLVDEARPSLTQAKTDSPPDEQPYEGPVDLKVILNECLAEISKYIVAERHQLVTLVLWAAMAHLIHNTAINLNVAPRLAIQAPDMGSGKTVTPEVLSCLCPRAEMASSITAAAIFRFISACKPTLLIDEADRLFRDKNEQLIAIMNSGHRRSSAHVIRAEENPNTGEWEPHKFSTWAAIAFAGIGRLPPTLQDRSIAFVLKRAKPGEVKRHLRDGSSPELTLQRRKLAAWAAQIVALPDIRMPDGLFNRHGDNWRPLLQIADAAGVSGQQWRVRPRGDFHRPKVIQFRCCGR